MNHYCCITPTAYEQNIRRDRIKAIASHIKPSTASHPDAPQVDAYADGILAMTRAIPRVGEDRADGGTVGRSGLLGLTTP